MDQEIYIEQDCILEDGDSVDALAADFGVSVDEIMEINPELGEGTILPTQVRIPYRVPACPFGTFYTVRRGDTLFRIARVFNVSVAEIQRANPYLNIRFLRPGTVICIPRRRRPFPGGPFPGRPIGTPVPGVPFPGGPFPGGPFPRPPVPGVPFPGGPFPGGPFPGVPY